MSPLGDFDQVVAITQKQINDALASRWKPENFSTKVEGEGSMEGVMNPPTVELVVPDEPYKSRFLLHFQSGKFVFWTKSDEDQKIWHTLSMDDWTLSFTSNHAPQPLSPSGGKVIIPQEIRQKVEKPGVYSIPQAVIALTTSDLLEFDFSHSVTPRLEGTKQQRALCEFMEAHLQQLSRSDHHNILGYSIGVYEPKPKMEDTPDINFRPVSVRLQAMLYEGDVGNPKPSDRDAFLFCEMFGGDSSRPQPRNALRGPFAWCPSPDFGTMAISRAAIWDRYFRDHLRFFNREAVNLLNRICIWVESDGQRGNHGQPSWPGVDIPWGLTQNLPPEFEGRPRPLPWTFPYDSDKSAIYKWDGPWHTKDIIKGGWMNPAVEDSVDSDSKAAVKVTMDPDTNHFIVNFQLSYARKHSARTTGLVPLSTPTYYSSASAEWTVKLAFNAIKTGHLYLDGQVEMKNSQCEKKWEYIVSRRTFGGDQTDKAMGQLIEHVIKERIAHENLQGDVNFVLPGAGFFQTKDPSFTKECDLQVKLAY